MDSSGGDGGAKAQRPLDRLLAMEDDDVADDAGASSRAVLPEVMARPDGLTDGRSSDGGDVGKVDMKKPFDVQVFLSGGDGTRKTVSVFRALPWDDLLTAIRSALRISAIDMVLDEQRAQVTTVEYLEPGDALEVLPLEIDALGRERAARGANAASAVLQCILPSASDLASPSAVPERDTFRERAKYIPLRLSLKERKLLRTMKAMLSASTYTDKIDIPFAKKAGRFRAQVAEICAMLTGIIMCLDYKAGQSLVEDRDFAQYKTDYQRIIEIARRHKIMNPEKMRTSYGKLLFLLQDALHERTQEMLEFPITGPMHTVYSHLEERGGLAIFDDEKLLRYATAEIADDKSKSRYEIQQMLKRKQRSIQRLIEIHRSSRLRKEDIENCLYSIGDNDSYLGGNRRPIDTMIRLLTRYFNPDKIEPGYSLAIGGAAEPSDSSSSSSSGGGGGAGDGAATKKGPRLTHSHARQFHFVLQSLMLWRAVTHDMFRLWVLAEQDLLDQSQGNAYKLTDTGQGLHRLQNCPRVHEAMREILHGVQQKVGVWIGSSVIHLGDKNVPNALMFIDKYTQVSRILNPIVLCIVQIPELYKRETLRRLFDDQFGGVEKIIKDILCDFFKHGFDGGGADNFFDAGSCIDGRLTSAWNWCSQLQTKPFYPIFKLAGFTSFDGTEFQE